MARLPVDGRIRTTPTGDYNAVRARRRHAGIDFAAPPGSVVYAPEDGHIVLVGRELWSRKRDKARRPGVYERTAMPLTRGVKLGGYGPGAVMLVGRSGVVHILGHLADDGLAPLGPIDEGQVVGVVASGVSPPHVHHEVRLAERAPWPTSTRNADTISPVVWLDAAKRIDPTDVVRVPDVELYAPGSSAMGWLLVLVVAFTAWPPNRRRS